MQSLESAIDKIAHTETNLTETVQAAKDLQDIQISRNGPEGTVSKKTVDSVKMIHKDLLQLLEIIAINPGYEQPINMDTCLTISVENIHAVSHFKDQTMTMQQYARNLGNRVTEGLKRVIPWIAYY